MSDFSGPGIYEILPMHALDKSLNLWGASTAAGAAIKLYPKTATAPNTLWEFVHAGGAQGNPEDGDRQYHILSVSSGLYITAAPNVNGLVTANLGSVKDVRCRWRLHYAGNGAFFINNVDNSSQLNVQGAGTATGTDLITYAKATATHCQFQLKVGP